jgi:hypothetical protein
VASAKHITYINNPYLDPINKQTKQTDRSTTTATSGADTTDGKPLGLDDIKK